MFGFLNINKPSRLTSRAVVNQVQRLVRPAKAGHAGTLDPLATGVLVIAVGSATRLIEYVQQASKRYVGEFLLGRSSDTEDISGEIDELESPRIPARAELEDAAAAMEGEILQRPPQYSALKIKGQRAYALARRGETVDLEPRKVRIDLCRVIAYEYPQFTLEVECGSGTYIRSLGRDIADRVGSAAVMSSLQRTAVGPFSVADALPPERLTPETANAWLCPPLDALGHLPRVELNSQEVADLSCGKPLTNRWEIDADEIVAIAGGERLAAILRPRGDRLAPLKNFPIPTSDAQA